MFTIPKILRTMFLFDRSLYGELCRVAYEVTRVFFAEHFPGLKRAVPAMVAAPQSWGTLLNFHPHAHALASLGVFDRDGVFHAAPFDLDFAPLEELFRERMLQRLHALGRIDDARVALLQSMSPFFRHHTSPHTQ